MQRFSEIAQLFFETRQIIRDNVPEKTRDPNAWMRAEAMRFVAAHDAPGMKELASYLRIQAPSATSLVRHLEKQGLAKRVACETDKRIVRIVPTAKGRQFVEKYESHAADIMQRVFGRLSEGELDDFVAVMRRVRSLHEGPASGMMARNEQRSRFARRANKET